MPEPTEDLPPHGSESGAGLGADADTETTGVHPHSAIRFDTEKDHPSGGAGGSATTETNAGPRHDTAESRESMGPGLGRTRPIEDRAESADSPTLQTDPGQNPRLAGLSVAPPRDQAPRSPERFPAGESKPVEPAEQSTPFHTPSNLLPGEAEEKPAPKPYSLRPKQEDTGGSASSSGSRQTAARRSRAQRAAWILLGMLLGAGAFAAVYLSNPDEASYPFPSVPPPVRSTGEELAKLTGLPADWEIKWTLQSGYFVGLGNGAIHLCDALARPPKHLGAIALKEGLPDATIAALVSEPEADGFRIAWRDGQAIRWESMAWPEGAGKPPEFAEEFSGSLPLTGEEAPYPPVKIENWTEKRSEGFVVALRTRDGDTLALIDVARSARDRKSVEELGLKGRLIAPPQAFFDSTPPGASLLFLATTEGACVVECSDGKLRKPEGSGRRLDFNPAFPTEINATVARARFGAGAKGWIIAVGGGYAVVEAAPGGALRMLVSPRNIDRAAARTSEASTALAYPNADDPSRDDAIIAWFNDGTKSFETKRIEALGQGEPAETELAEIASSDLAAWDLNGDGRREIASLSRSNGELKIYAWPRFDSNRASANPGSGKLGLGRAVWTGGAGSLEAFYFSAEGEPVRIVIPLFGKMRDDLDRILTKDQRWRAGRLPF